jgi:chromosome segregation ATPase
MAELKDVAVIESEMYPVTDPAQTARDVSKFMTDIHDAERKRTGDVDQRTIGMFNVQREFDIKTTQLEGNEKSLHSAETAVVDLTGRIAQLQETRRKYERMRQLPDVLRRIEGCDAEIGRVREMLGQQKANFERMTKIVESQKKILAEWLAHRPFEGALTNLEVLEELKELAALDKIVANTPNSLPGAPSIF